MTEPRRSTRARAREEAEAAATPSAPEAALKPSDTPSRKAPKSNLKRKRSEVVKETIPANATLEGPQEPPGPVLPTRITDGEPLPTLPEPQPLDLLSNEYQDVRESGVLSASLQRSRAVWASGSNFRLFHKHFVGPKKVADRTDEDKAMMARQKEIHKNFPQLGGNGVTAQLTIEPHTFSIRLYGPREVVRHVQKKPPPQYGQWPNHNQPPYYHQPQQHPPQTPQMHHAQHTPQQHRPSYSPATPYVKPTPPPPRPPQPKPQEKPPPSNPPPATPAPDPVIHMLAQRAGVDPVLKQTMKVVAEGRATKEELELFQKHINEFNLIVEKQKAEAAKAAKAAKAQAASSPAPPAPVPYRPSPAPYQQPQTPQSAGPAPQQQQSHHQRYPPKPYQPPMTPSSQHHGPPPQIPPQPRHTPHPNQYTYNQHHHQHMAPYSPAVQPVKTTYRPLIFDFAEEGNQDKFYFPSYSIMEWLPNNQGAKFSFLLTKMKDKPKEEPKERTVQSAPASNGTNMESNAGPGATNGTPNPNGFVPPAGTAVVPATPGPDTNSAGPNTPLQGQQPVVGSGHGPFQSQGQGQPQSQPPPQPQQPPPTPQQQQQQVRIEDFDERNDIGDIDFYYPVTMIVQATHYEILQSLPRAVRPQEVVVSYMEEVFDRCKRAEETFLAFRLPREGAADASSAIVTGRGSGEGTLAVGMAGAGTAGDVVMGEVVERKRVKRA
ncbi:uncharacterized protein EI97DRAFT_93693 [Westerdykella ornata]|uniref:SWR1-complex protein 3 domain-containing protein n=1 Tax=Westerdykella ornata TaxID=318751 RepID=A0A6A6JF97_WESOR|nr:uncharacterized protein EI97DRAFT_93693 [Westerdykella ornata]KAF2274914.1 hypothetical protein EI97DRAFT_93693 [Westerdykella ornata]